MRSEGVRGDSQGLFLMFLGEELRRSGVGKGLEKSGGKGMQPTFLVATKPAIIVLHGHFAVTDKLYQHKIPQGYLKSWAHPNPRPSDIGKVWVFQKGNVA